MNTNYKRDKSESMTTESRMYVYATEMISEYYSKFDINGKEVLTIIGSADQIINAYFFGAHGVVGFDINKRAQYFFDLKWNALKYFSYKEFLNYFGDHFDNATFNERLYKKISNSLTKSTRIFFDSLYSEISGSDFLKSDYFRMRTFLKIATQKINPYLRNRSSYLKAQKIILATEYPEVIESNVSELPKKLKGNVFDIINLSNIPNYFVGWSTKSIEKLPKLVSSLSILLKKNGLIFFYSYSPFIYENGNVPHASGKTATKILQKTKGFKTKIEYLTPLHGKGKDRIFILQKLK